MSNLFVVDRSETEICITAYRDCLLRGLAVIGTIAVLAVATFVGNTVPADRADAAPSLRRHVAGTVRRPSAEQNHAAKSAARIAIAALRR